MNKFLEMGLKESRYFQMMKSFGNEKFIEEAIEIWGIENVNKGYEIFNFDGLGIFQIEEIGDTDAFNGSDDAATLQAQLDGIKIIPIEELPSNFDRKYLGWIDTPENRNVIEKYCSEDNYYCNGNSLKN
jgi:hypothetical protein